MFTRTCTLAISVVCLQGCALLTPPLEQPVIEEKLNRRLLSHADVGTLSLTPERRVVLVHFDNKRFCAEPPTEIGMDLSRVIQASAQASKGTELSAGLSGLLANTVQNAVLNKRTQGLQFYLASSFYLCQMYMNNAIDSRDLVELQLRIFNAAGPLIDKEIAYIHTTPAPNGTKSTFKPLDANEAIRDLTKPKSPAPAASSPGGE